MSPRRSPKREQLALAELTAKTNSTKDVFVTRSESSSTGVSLHIVGANIGHVDAATEASAVIDALLDLPVETRRALYLLLTQEFADTFNGAAQAKSVKKHPWPPKPRRPQ